jgi:hypothetical protein
MVIKELLQALGQSPLTDYIESAPNNVSIEVRDHVKRITDHWIQDMDADEIAGICNQLSYIGQHLSVGLHTLGIGAPESGDVGAAIEAINDPGFIEELGDRVPCVRILANESSTLFHLGAVEAFAVYYIWLDALEDLDDVKLALIDEVADADVCDPVVVDQISTKSKVPKEPLQQLIEVSYLNCVQNVNISIIGSQLILSGDIIEVTAAALTEVEACLDSLTTSSVEKRPYTIGAYHGLLKFTLTL